MGDKPILEMLLKELNSPNAELFEETLAEVFKSYGVQEDMVKGYVEELKKELEDALGYAHQQPLPIASSVFAPVVEVIIEMVGDDLLSASLEESGDVGVFTMYLKSRLNDDAAKSLAVLLDRLGISSVIKRDEISISVVKIEMKRK